MENTVNFQWTEMNDDTFKTIAREGVKTSIEVLAVGMYGACEVGRIYKHERSKTGYSMKLYVGYGFNDVVKFVKLSDIIDTKQFKKKNTSLWD